jgi:hypothetical protein
MNMLKKILFALLLAVQAATVVSVATADSPIPDCGPCPGDPKPPPAVL